MGCCLSTPVDFEGEVNLYHFDLHRVVGKGAFGKVSIYLLPSPFCPLDSGSLSGMCWIRMAAPSCGRDAVFGCLCSLRAWNTFLLPVGRPPAVAFDFLFGRSEFSVVGGLTKSVTWV